MKTILSTLLAVLFFLPLISAQIANLTFYGVWIGAGPFCYHHQSSSHLLSCPFCYPFSLLTTGQFESTLILPTGSPDKTPANDVQAFWPGMEPASMGSVFQNVITNQGGGPGEWYLLPFYCCKYVLPLFFLNLYFSRQYDLIFAIVQQQT
jgi:hypothetical protein